MKLSSLLAAGLLVSTISGVSFAQTDTFTKEECREIPTRIILDEDAGTSYSANLKTVVETVRYTTTYPSTGSGLITGDGSSSNWNGFFNVSKDKKADALAKTVLGIGPARADVLVVKNQFSNKPRSWQAFKNVLQNAEDQLSNKYPALRGMTAQVSGSQYAKNNQINLGYLVPTQGSTQPPKTTKEILKTEHFNKDISVRLNMSTKPLPSESQAVKLYSGACDRGSSGITYVSESRPYDVSVSQSGSSITINASRVKIGFPGFSFKASLNSGSGNVQLTNIAIHRSGDADAILRDLKRNGGSVSVSGKVTCAVKDGSGIYGNGTTDETIGTIGSQNLTNLRDGSIQTNISATCEKKVKATLNMSINNSSYYNGNSVTQTKKVNKPN